MVYWPSVPWNEVQWTSIPGKTGILDNKKTVQWTSVLEKTGTIKY